MHKCTFVVEGLRASLVASGERHEVHGGHGRRVPEHGDAEPPGEALARRLQVVDLDLEPALLRHRVLPQCTSPSRETI